jgi:hypothetical protein
MPDSLPEEEIDGGDGAGDETGHMDIHDTSARMEIDAELGSHASQDSIYDTDLDSFGVLRSYYRQPPSFTSDVSLESLCNSPNLAVSRKVRKWWSGITGSLPAELSAADVTQEIDAAIAKLKENYFRPFESATSFLLMRWFYSGSNMKTLAELDRLVQDVLLKPDFSLEDLATFRAARESQRIDVIKDKTLADSLFKAADGWYKVAINIPVPFERVKHDSISDVPTFRIESLFFRRPTEVLRAALQDAPPEEFHLQPFKMYWQRDENDPTDPERIYTDLYNADEFLNEHDHIQHEHGASEYENVIASIMLWSDSTQLANFGTASLWPIYLFVGNQSKYVRCKPKAFAAHHIAYIPKVYFVLYFKSYQIHPYLQLSDKIQDFCQDKFGKPATSNVLTHLRRELMHEVWKIILDNEFIIAYTRGFLTKFTDGTVRRVFPRIFTYSADYPEKSSIYLRHPVTNQLIIL